MNYSLRKIAFVLSLLALFTACGNDDDDFHYPDLLTEFVDFYTNSEGNVDRFTTDNGATWNINLTNGLTGLKADTTYRVVARYVPDADSEKRMAKLYASEGVIAPVPVKTLNAGSIKTDPVKIQSIWRGGDYVNIVLNVLVKDKYHKYSFVQNSLTSIDAAKKRLKITLYHDQNGDALAFYRNVYLSIPLFPYKGILKSGDEIEVDINTYNDGVVSTMLNY